MHPFKDSLRFYARHIESLLVISLLVVFPFLLLHNFIMNTINLIAMINGAKVVASFFNLFLMILIVTVVQLPFARYLESDGEGEERPLRLALRTFAEHGFSIFCFGLLYAMAVTLGMLLFVLPGLIVLVLFYLTPFLMVLKNQSPWRCWRQAVALGKRHFPQIFGLLVLVGLLEMGIGLLGFFVVTAMTTSFGAIFFTQIVLNVILFPFIAILFAFCTRKWLSESVTEELAEAAALPE